MEQLYSTNIKNVSWQYLNNGLFVVLIGCNIKMYRHFFKRLLSFLLALVALLCIGWLIVIIAIWLHFANKGAGAFFMQERPGKDGKIFKVIKFKTMTDERDSDGNLLPDDMRLTRIGKIVRTLSVDELPQLFNVLIGDM